MAIAGWPGGTKPISEGSEGNCQGSEANCERSEGNCQGSEANCERSESPGLGCEGNCERSEGWVQSSRGISQSSEPTDESCLGSDFPRDPSRGAEDQRQQENHAADKMPCVARERPFRDVYRMLNR